MAFAMSQLGARGLARPARDVRKNVVLSSSRAGPRIAAVQRTAVPVTLPSSAQRPSRGALQVVASSAEDKVKSLDRKSRSVDLSVEQDSRADYANLLAAAGFVAYWYNKVNVDRLLLLKTIAVLQIFVAVSNLLTRAGTIDKVTTIIGPAVLAVFVLNIQVSFLDAATALFGFYLAGQIEGPFWLWVATLAGALYYGYGTLWYSVAFGLVSLFKFIKSTKDEDRLPLLSIPAVLVTAFAIYTERHFVWALLLYIAQAVWSGFTTVEKLAEKVEG